MTVLQAMSEAEYATWLAQAIPNFADEKVKSGQWAAEGALAQSEKDHQTMLPQGVHTSGQCFFTIRDAQEQVVGTLWYAEQTRGDAQIAYLYDIHVFPQFQRQGHAQAAIFALEKEVARRGLAGLALHVFGHNPAAYALYCKLGFQPTNINMFKSLSHAEQQP